MHYLIFFFLINTAQAGSTPDTCAMAETSLHTLIGDQLARHSSRAFKKRKEIMNQRSVQAAKEVIAGRQRNAAIQGVEANLFAAEPKFFTGYRNYLEHNPCIEMKPQLRDALLAAREIVVNQCLKRSNPSGYIYLNKRMRWDSQQFLKGSIYIDSQCSPKLNTGELYSMHQLTNGLNASIEKLCQAAWSGIKEVWSKAQVCQGRNGWYDIKEWSQGNIVKKPTPK